MLSYSNVHGRDRDKAGHIYLTRKIFEKSYTCMIKSHLTDLVCNFNKPVID